MKKLLISLILFIAATMFFAEPKVPKGDGSVEPLFLLSNDCQSCFRIFMFSPSGKGYGFQFTKYSLVNDSLIAIEIHCKSEKEADALISDIDVSDLDNEFIKLRKKIIKLGYTPYVSERNNLPYRETYTLDYTPRLKD